MSAAFQNDLDELHAALSANMGALAEDLLGPCNKALSRGSELRFGRKGSLSVEVRGREQGSWKSYEGSGPGGGPFQLIMYARHCDRDAAVAWGRTWIGVGNTPRAQPRPARPSEPDLEKQAEDTKAIATARGMAHACEAVAGTIAEHYLVEVRGIPRPADGWPSVIRFHGATRSLLAVSTLADGSVQAVQRVHLTKAGQKAEAPAKITNGRQAGAAVRLPRRSDTVLPANILLLAEGPENGLSVWGATGAETWLVFGVGEFQKVVLPPDRHTILCRDDDRQHSAGDKAVRKAVASWRTTGANVSVATPWESPRQDKSDVNDVLRLHGVEALLARLRPHVPTSSTLHVNRVPVAVAREQLDQAVRKFFKAASNFDHGVAASEGALPPVHGVKVGVGIGKSHAARHHAAELLINLRRAGDQRTVGLAVPTHRLGLEQAARWEALEEVRAAGLSVAVWRGRGALNPEHPDYANPAVPDSEKPTMCGNLIAVYEAQSYGLKVDEAACRRTVSDGPGEKVVHECSLFSTCAYQAQRKRKADFWIVPHEVICSEKPKAIGELAALVVDESAWQPGLEGVTGRGDCFPLDALRGCDRRMRDGDHSPDWMTLQHHRGQILDALHNASDGPITREIIVAEGLTAKGAAEARALSFSRLIDPKIHPGMTRTKRTALLKEAEGNRTLLQEARFWRAVEALLADGGPSASGWAVLATESTPDGPQKVIRLRGRRPVRKGWQVPTLLIDALLNPALVRPFWPQLKMVADIQAEAPHQSVVQVIDRAYSKSRLAPLDAEEAKANPEEARRRVRARREARAIFARFARKHSDKRVLVVAQKIVRAAIEAEGPLPRNLEMAHHNAVAGRDEWGDVAGLSVLGCTTPSPCDVERMAEALTGAAVEPIPGWYPRTPAIREIAGKPGMAAEKDSHPDLICEAIRWHICEGGLVNTIGRGRGGNRSEANPLDALVMTDAVLPIPIHVVTGSADLAPTTAEQMLAECGFAFENPRHAAAACPALWPGEKGWDAAKKAMAREATSQGQKGTNPYKNISIGVCPLLPALGRIDYQRAGPRHSPASASFDSLLVDDPVAKLEALLGPLAWCEVMTSPSPALSPAISPAPTPEPPAGPPPVELPMPLAAAARRQAEHREQDGVGSQDDATDAQRPSREGDREHSRGEAWFLEDRLQRVLGRRLREAGQPGARIVPKGQPAPTGPP